MSKRTVYLSGPLEAFKDDFKKSNSWREEAKEYFKAYHPNIQTFNPNDYWNFNDKTDYNTEREVMEFDLFKLRESDLLLVNFNAQSIGTAMEIAIAYELRKPIIGVVSNSFKLHSWEKEMCNRIFLKLYKALDYIATYYDK